MITDETIAKSAKDERDANDQRKKREGEIIEKAREAAKEKKKWLTLPEGVERWTAENCDEKFGELQSGNLKADRKKEVMKQQWKYIAEWAELGKMKPGPAPAGGVEAMYASLRNKLHDMVFMRKVDASMVLYADEADMAGNVLGAELGRLPAVTPMEEEDVESKKRKWTESANEDVRSKKHRTEAGEDQMMGNMRMWQRWCAPVWDYKKSMAKAARAASKSSKQAKRGADEEGGVDDEG